MVFSIPYKLSRLFFKKDMTVVGLSKVPIAVPLEVLTDKHVWVEQWPLLSEKLQVLEQLVDEQLKTQHIEESTSPRSPLCLL